MTSIEILANKAKEAQREYDKAKRVVIKAELNKVGDFSLISKEATEGEALAFAMEVLKGIAEAIEDKTLIYLTLMEGVRDL